MNTIFDGGFHNMKNVLHHSTTHINTAIDQRFLLFQKHVIQNNTAYDRQQIQSLCKHLFG